MITYNRGGILFFLKVFQLKGSVFPVAFCIALPCAAATAVLRLSIERGWVSVLGEGTAKSVLKDNACWSGFVFLVGFLIVFRTSQAYARFWDGCTSTHQMRAEWFDACSALIAFCKHAKASNQAVAEFQHTLVRLFSMLHAVALAEIEDSSSDEITEVMAFKYELVDAGGIDADSLKAVKESDARVELVYQWIQQLIVENIKTGVLHIPAPILSRAFQEIANGMVAFHEAIKISTIPFPFPYAQTCEALLLIHWAVTPIVLAQWVSTPWWGALFSFIQVFIYWSLNSIAVEIENPFGMDANDIDAGTMQEELNRHLLLLLEPQTLRTPRLTAALCNSLSVDLNGCGTNVQMSSRRQSFAELWSTLEMACLEDPPARTVRARRPSQGSASINSMEIETRQGLSSKVSLVSSRRSSQSSYRASVNGHVVREEPTAVTFGLANSEDRLASKAAALATAQDFSGAANAEVSEGHYAAVMASPCIAVGVDELGAAWQRPPQSGGLGAAMRRCEQAPSVLTGCSTGTPASATAREVRSCGPLVLSSSSSSPSGLARTEGQPAAPRCASMPSTRRPAPMGPKLEPPTG